MTREPLPPCPHCGERTVTAKRKIVAYAFDWYDETGEWKDAVQGHPEGLISETALKTLYCGRCERQRRDLMLIPGDISMRVVPK